VAALGAVTRSCNEILKADPAKLMGGAGYAGSYSEWHTGCRILLTQPDPRSFFENTFVPFAVSGGAVPDGLFTGYYEPELSASRARQGKFQTPIYWGPHAQLH